MLLELPPIPGSAYDCFAGCEAQHQQTAFAKKLAEDGHPPVTATRCAILFGTALAVFRGGKFLTCPGVDEAGAFGPHWFAGCGMLVAGGFCYRMLVDKSRIARESQNSPDSCACLRPAPQHLGIFIPATPGPPGLERTMPRARKAGGDTFSTGMPWRRVMRRARFKNRRGCLGPGACDPSGISDTRPVSWTGRKPSAVHATGALDRPPTSLVKSSPTWIDASRT
jgi:hypothetical protein